MPSFFTGEGRRRFDLDWAAVSAKYRSLDYLREGSALCIYGNITVQIGTRGDILRTAPILVVLPLNYPISEPLGFVDPETFKKHPEKSLSDRHFNEQGRCCFELISSWDPGDERALFKWIENFVLFIHRQFIYDANGGRWPGPEWKHAGDGWIEYVEETLPALLIPALASAIVWRGPRRRAACVCGSGKSYASCHKREVDNVIGQIHSLHRREVGRKLLARHVSTPP